MMMRVDGNCVDGKENDKVWILEAIAAFWAQYSEILAAEEAVSRFEPFTLSSLAAAVVMI